MKILFKSIKLFMYGLYVESYKHKFDRVIDRRIKNGGDISSPRLTKMSNKSYSLYMKFKEYENILIHEMTMKKLMN